MSYKTGHTAFLVSTRSDFSTSVLFLIRNQHYKRRSLDRCVLQIAVPPLSWMIQHHHRTVGHAIARITTLLLCLDRAMASPDPLRLANLTLDVRKGSDDIEELTTNINHEPYRRGHGLKYNTEKPSLTRVEHSKMLDEALMPLLKHMPSPHEEFKKIVGMSISIALQRGLKDVNFIHASITRQLDFRHKRGLNNFVVFQVSKEAQQAYRIDALTKENDFLAHEIDLLRKRIIEKSTDEIPPFFYVLMCVFLLVLVVSV